MAKGFRRESMTTSVALGTDWAIAILDLSNMKNENILTSDFEELALCYFEFLQTDYRFSNPLFERGSTFENIGYTKGTLGVLLSYDALDQICTIYFFDASNGFPPENKVIIDYAYYARCKSLPAYNPRELNLPNPRLKNGFLREGGLEIEVSNNAKILSKYFRPILETDVFVY